MLFFSALFLPEDVWEVCMFMHFFPCNCASFWMYVLYSRTLSNTTHPCLLSSSGSGPVELERRAQLLSASEDFILRTQKHKNNAVSTSKNCSTFLQLCAHNISAIAQTQWQNRTQVVGFFFQYQCHCFSCLFNLYLTRVVSWDRHILFRKLLADK